MTKQCRDCGNELEPAARGCPGCAMNFAAEHMIDHFIWRRLVPSIVLIVIIALLALFLLRR